MYVIFTLHMDTFLLCLKYIVAWDYCLLDVIHCLMYVIHCFMYVIHFFLYMLHCFLSVIHCFLYVIHCFNVCDTFFDVCDTLFYVYDTVKPLITNTSEEFIKCRLDNFSMSFILYYVNFRICDNK